MTRIKAIPRQETTCAKHQVWAGACQHLCEFIKEAFTDVSLFQLPEGKSSYVKRKQEPEKRQLFDYAENKKVFINLAKSGLTMNEISKFFNPCKFRKLKRMLKHDKSLKELLPREIYFNLFELTGTQYKIKVLLDKGLTHGKIRQILCMNKNAFEAHERRIRRKLGLPIRKYNKKN